MQLIVLIKIYLLFHETKENGLFQFLPVHMGIRIKKLTVNLFCYVYGLIEYLF